MKLLANLIEDILMFLGLSLIIATTFYINVIAGDYLLGIILTGLGFILAKKQG